jgi:hypothetical protein
MPFGTCSEEIIDREVVNRKHSETTLKTENERRVNCLIKRRRNTV